MRPMRDPDESSAFTFGRGDVYLLSAQGFGTVAAGIRSPTGQRRWRPCASDVKRGSQDPGCRRFHFRASTLAPRNGSVRNPQMPANPLD